MKYMDNYLDSSGFICQRDNKSENYIDSNFLTSNYLYQSMYLDAKSFVKGVSLDHQGHLFNKYYTTSSGKLMRYHKNFDYLKSANKLEYSRYTDYNTVSRDNSMGHIILRAKLGCYAQNRQFLYDIIKRGFTFQNKITVKGEPKFIADLCGPEHLATILRSCWSPDKLKYLYPLFLVLDLFFLLSILVHVIRSYYDSYYCSTVFHTMSAMLQFKETLQTPISKLSTLLFFLRKKPTGYESYGTLESCLRRYSRSSFDPPIYDLSNMIEGELKCLKFYK